MWIAAMAVAHACSCAGAGPIEDGVAQAEYGFYGEVVARGDFNWLDGSITYFDQVDIEVLEPFLGVAWCLGVRRGALARAPTRRRREPSQPRGIAGVPSPPGLWVHRCKRGLAATARPTPTADSSRSKGFA